jgi:hypothetical protein
MKRSWGGSMESQFNLLEGNVGPTALCVARYSSRFVRGNARDHRRATSESLMETTEP